MKTYSIHFNRPDFISIQNQFCKKIGYNLVVINNGGNEEIHKACIQEEVEEIQTKNIGTNSVSHANSINQLFEIASDLEDCGIIDHDLFLLKPLDFKNNNIVALKQSRGSFSYFWPGFLFWKKEVLMKKINFLPNNLGDTGSNTSLILKDPNSKINFVKEKHMCDAVQPKSIQSDGYSELYLNDELVAIHAINGSNWRSGFSKTKTEKLNNLIKNTLDN